MSNGEVTPLQSPVWVDGVTPLNSVNMTQLQTRDEKDAPSGYVGLDAGRNIAIPGYVAVTQASVGVAFASAVTGDSANRYLVDTNGKITWSPGNAPADTNLYRSAAADLVTDGAFEAYSGLWGRVSAGNVAVGAYVTGETTDRWEVLGSGKLRWGPGGTTAPDTNLYRFGANFLASDGQFWAGWGATPGNAYVAVVASGDGWPRLGMLNDGKLWFGPGTAGPDTNLYRAAAGILATDSVFRIFRPAQGNEALSTQIGGSLYFSLRQDGYLSWLGDTNLYRSAANTLKTDGSLNVGGVLNLSTFSDVDLFRSGTSMLKTSAMFTAFSITTLAQSGSAMNDGYFGATPPDGTIVLTLGNNKLWARLNGVWKGVVLA